MIEKERQAREKREQEAVANDEQLKPAVQAQEGGELHWRATVARPVVSIQGNNQSCQRSSIPLDGNG